MINDTRSCVQAVDVEIKISSAGLGLDQFRNRYQSPSCPRNRFNLVYLNRRLSSNSQ